MAVLSRLFKRYGTQFPLLLVNLKSGKESHVLNHNLVDTRSLIQKSRRCATGSDFGLVEGVLFFDIGNVKESSVTSASVWRTSK